MSFKTLTELKEWINNTISETLEEMPIDNYKTIGDFSKNSSISSPVDRALLTHPKAIEKIKKQWQKTPYNFDIFVINDPRVNKYDFREVGEVNESFVREQLKLTPEEVPINSDNITILFINNRATEKVPLSGWVMAHRLGHAIARSNNDQWNDFIFYLRKTFDDILKNIYGIDTKRSWNEIDNVKKEKILKYVAQQLGTMKSARDNNLRNWNEFGHELLAQYIITGKIKFNPLPDSIITKIRGWGHKDYARSINKDFQKTYNTFDLDYYAGGLNDYLDNVLSSCVSRIFVM